MLFTTHRLGTKLCIALEVLLCCCALLKAQSQCGNPTGNICPSHCGNSTGFQFNSQGPDYGVNAWVACGANCSMINANIPWIWGGCNEQPIRTKLLANSEKDGVSCLHLSLDFMPALVLGSIDSGR